MIPLSLSLVPTLSFPVVSEALSFDMVILETTALLFHLDSTSQDELLVFLKDLPKPESGQNPPHIYEWHDKEKSLPQHDPICHIHKAGKVSLGWGNAMQEMVLNAHLAYLAKRIYVFENYTWDKTSDDFSNYNGKPIPARALNRAALCSGRVVGDPFPSSMDAPPAVVPEFYDVCPNPTIIDSTEINGGLSEPSAATTLQAWIDKLEKTEDRCVEIKEHQGRSSIYGPEMLIETSKRLLDIWPSLDTSPILTHFSWSLLVYSHYTSDVETTASIVKIPGFNEFPRLPDWFLSPAAHSRGNAPPEELARYRARCFPEIDQIVSRVRDGMDEWEHIGTSRDLRLTRERRHNFQVVDMAIAQRSEVFLGNGFSSMTSNVVMLRAAQGMDWNKTRFW
ncbi:hypothetical protein BGW80DRAFT_1484786 [Lactifluus volemus]|nr:hypothetical protein BGW80DRAFT_1484786 [Lactifluus volemus]